MYIETDEPVGLTLVRLPAAKAPENTIAPGILVYLVP
jgi:hypothetical protein